MFCPYEKLDFKNNFKVGLKLLQNLIQLQFKPIYHELEIRALFKKICMQQRKNKQTNKQQIKANPYFPNPNAFR